MNSKNPKSKTSSKRKEDNDDLSCAENGRPTDAAPREGTSSAVPAKRETYKKEQSGRKCRCCQGFVANRVIPMLVLIGVAIGTVIFLKQRGLILQGDVTLIPMTMEEVALHDSPDDCWMVLYGTVYDFTDYARRHPGGDDIITDLAGTDGTEAYEDFHRKRLLKSVKDARVGTLVEFLPGGSSSGNGENAGCTEETGSNSPNEGGTTGDATTGGNNNNNAGTISTEELALHNTPDNCWVALHGTVYDLTEYAKKHPGGANIVTNLAGKDGTRAYLSAHRKSLLDKTATKYVVGPLANSQRRVGSTVGCTGNTPSTSIGDDTDDLDDSSD